VIPTAKYRWNHYFGFSDSALPNMENSFSDSALPNMENSREQEHDHAIALPHEDRGSYQFKGIRLRKWGSWVSEIRIPRTREKLWLGSYTTPEQAARAFDAALYCLRGPNAKFNFSVPDIPSASSLSRRQIQHAAVEYALGQPPSSLLSFVGHASPSQSSSVSEMELSGDKHQISEEWQDLALWRSLFAGSDGAGTPNLETFPSIDEVSALELIPTSQ